MATAPAVGEYKIPKQIFYAGAGMGASGFSKFLDLRVNVFRVPVTNGSIIALVEHFHLI
jgi:hypothetical protein